MMEWVVEKTWKFWIALVGLWVVYTLLKAEIWKLLFVLAIPVLMVCFLVGIGYLTMTEYSGDWKETPKVIQKIRNTPVGAVLVALAMIAFVLFITTFSLPND